MSATWALDHSPSRISEKVLPVEEPSCDDLVGRPQQEPPARRQHDVGDEVPGPDEHDAEDERREHDAALAAPVGAVKPTDEARRPGQPGRRRRSGRLGSSDVMRVPPAAPWRPRPLSTANAGSKRRSGGGGTRNGTSNSATIGPGGRHHEHPGAQEHGLADRVGDEQPGEALGLEQLERLVVEVLAGDLVDGAERLVEQEHRRRSVSERASEQRIRMPPDSDLG